ncbi:MAG: gliding motility-associated C-terminal domain-containing protein [Flavobacteriales bacterium]|nr:gliding motility-associated C-terminal domain-containing protein [Flavobacteriales bacterium]
MSLSGSLRPLFFTLLLLVAGTSRAQVFPFTSGPIPLCATSTFTANVSGVGTLITPDGWNWGPYIDNVVLNITTDHPQTLQISLTSPQGTTLLLSAFNGAGGENYTNTSFPYWGGSNITTASAPFTGSYNPQGGSLSVFDWENADGIWTITVVDTACASSGPGPGNGWTPGWFNGASSGGGGFAFGFSSPPPPCGGWMGDQLVYICQGQTVDILSYYATMYPGIPFTVYDGNYVPVADPTSVGTSDWYYVEGMDPWDGCYYYGNYQLIVNQPISLGPDQVVERCSSDGPVNLVSLFTLTGLGTTWSLDGSMITSAMAASATAPGVYQLIATNNGGCNDTALVTLIVTSDPDLGPDQSLSLCPGESADLGALFITAGYSVEWTFNGAVLSNPDAVSDAGVYTLVASTASGCSDMAEVTVSASTAPALGADQALDVCANELVDLTALYNTTGGTAAWTFAGAPVPNPAAVNTAGTYELVLSSAGNCTDTALVTLSALPNPDLGADAAAGICAGNAVDLNAVIPATGLTASWTLAGVAVADPAAVAVAGTYTLIATNAAGCSDTALVVVSVAANPALGPDQSLTVCAGTAVDLTALYATGAATTSWTMNGVAVALPGAVTSSGTYTLTATNAAGCSATAAVLVQVDPSPALGADQVVGSCAGSGMDLTALYNTAGLTTAWTLAGAAVSDPAAVSQSGNYQLVVTNGFNCTDTAVVTYTAFVNPSLGADQVFSLCPWQSVDLTAVFPVSGMSATYTLNGVAVSDPTQVVDAGSYVISVVDANGCTAVATATVLPIECLCVADFVEDARCMQEPVQFTLLADSTVLAAYWDFHGAGMNATGTEPEVRFLRPGELLVTLYASLSCGEVAVERIVNVPDCSDSCTVYIPSAFTPDGDGINDRWTWGGECPPEDFSVIVFDRWGKAVFESKDPWRAWDGTVGGKEVPTGVYVYRAAYRLLYQEHKEVSGSITLIR